MLNVFLTGSKEVKIATVTKGTKITVLVDTSQTPPIVLSVQYNSLAYSAKRT